MDKDWFIAEYERRIDLHNQRFTFMKYDCGEGDHDHCDLCWARFSRHPIDCHEGYYNHKSKNWICTECFNNFKSLFGWETN